MKREKTLPEDTLTQKIGVLTRREVEARILAPVLANLGRRFDPQGVTQILSETIMGGAEHCDFRYTFPG